MISEKPNLDLAGNEFQVKASWSVKETGAISHWLLYKKYGDNWETEILESPVTTREINKKKGDDNLEFIVIQAVDRLGNESEYEAKKVG